MKIISKFKDYYDWVVFETDNRKVYNRETKILKFKKAWYSIQDRLAHPDKHDELLVDFQRNKLTVPKRPYYDRCGFMMVYLYICGDIYLGLYKSETQEYFWDINKLSFKDLTAFYKEREESKRHYYYFSNTKWDDELGLYMVGKEENRQVVKTKINEQLKFPIVFEFGSSLIVDPCLSKIGFKVMSPERIYQDIYNFIEYVEPSNLPGSPTDMDRYEAKGFDKKTSFRPKMK